MKAHSTQNINLKHNTFCGFIAIVGKSNVGKSTLINRLVGEKISITAHRPQTTRRKILGIKTIHNKQAVYIDTPGISYNGTSQLNSLMNKAATSAFQDIDLILFVANGYSIDLVDQKILKSIFQRKHLPPIFLVMNKIDLIKDQNPLFLNVQKLSEQYQFTEIFPISAKKNTNLNILETAIFNRLPESQHYFLEQDLTDQRLTFRMAEIIREKIIKNVSQELPYVTNVEISNVNKKQTLYHIDATIWVEKTGQKKIVIGEKGQKLKTIGTQARLELEFLLNSKVFLNLFVQVKPNWTNDKNHLKNHV
jgi:GTPase